MTTTTAGSAVEGECSWGRVNRPCLPPPAPSMIPVEFDAPVWVVFPKPPPRPVSQTIPAVKVSCAACCETCRPEAH